MKRAMSTSSSTTRMTSGSPTAVLSVRLLPLCSLCPFAAWFVRRRWVRLLPHCSFSAALFAVRVPLFVCCRAIRLLPLLSVRCHRTEFADRGGRVFGAVPRGARDERVRTRLGAGRDGIFGDPAVDFNA